jgi:hypothetical protein
LNQSKGKTLPMEDFLKNATNCLEALFVNAKVEFARWWWWKLFQCS